MCYERQLPGEFKANTGNYSYGRNNKQAIYFCTIHLTKNMDETDSLVCTCAWRAHVLGGGGVKRAG
jgi:hypothetical protein